jgi:hypothetical protein
MRRQLPVAAGAGVTDRSACDETRPVRPSE